MRAVDVVESVTGGLTALSIVERPSRRLRLLWVSMSCGVPACSYSTLFTFLLQTRVTSNAVVALGCLGNLACLALYETRVRSFAKWQLLAANAQLEVQGVA